MSALRLGRLPDGTRHVVPQEPAVGRISISRMGIRGGGPPVVGGAYTVGESAQSRADRLRREWAARQREAAK